MITLYRNIPEQNMHRFYRFYLQATLFGENSLVREFGRIGQSGRVMVDHFACREEAEVTLQHLLSQKLGKGYRPSA